MPKCQITNNNIILKHLIKLVIKEKNLVSRETQLLKEYNTKLNKLRIGHLEDIQSSLALIKKLMDSDISE